MTSSFAQPESTRRGPDPVSAIVLGVIGGIVVLTLIVAGLTFAALAIAFPIAVPLAADLHLPVKAVDVALAQRFADVWWVFAAAAVTAIAAAGAIVVKLINVLSPGPRD